MYFSISPIMTIGVLYVTARWDARHESGFVQYIHGWFKQGQHGLPTILSYSIHRFNFLLVSGLKPLSFTYHLVLLLRLVMNEWKTRESSQLSSLHMIIHESCVTNIY